MKCCYCGNNLDGGHIEGIPAWDHQILWREDADARYCSAECLFKRVGELFIRTKLPRERWPRFTVEVPPELAALLDAVQKRALRVNRSAASRAGLILYLEATAIPPAPAIDAVAEVEADVPELPPAADKALRPAPADRLSQGACLKIS
jgi:hypothetical protein